MINGTRPNGTVATYTCDGGFMLDGNATRICNTGNWTGTVPVCIESKSCMSKCMYVCMVLFSPLLYSYRISDSGVNIIGYVVASSYASN